MFRQTGNHKRTAAKYHAGKHGQPLCGTRGNGNRSNVICLSVQEWNATRAEHRCIKCALKIAEKAKKNQATRIAENRISTSTGVRPA